MSSWDDLTQELDAWREASRHVEFWLRDDDAGKVEDPLIRLVDLCGEYRVPANFAAIPANSTTETAHLFDTLDDGFVLVHGYAHVDHAGAGERKAEFSITRPAADMEKDWVEGLRLVREIYGVKAISVFVPPWNRMAPELQAQLAKAGFTGYSGLGARASKIAYKLAIANVHVDMIDSRKHAFRGEEPTLTSVLHHLRAKRAGQVDSTEPTGVMTHHLVFDDDSWVFLRQLFAATVHQDCVRWLSGREIFGIAA